MLVFLDSSVFIWAYNRPESNSAKILGLVDAGKLEAVTSEKALEETGKYFNLFYDSRTWFSVKQHLVVSAKIIWREEISALTELLRGKIKNKDVEHLATARYAGARVIIAFDRDFLPFTEYHTPRQFIAELGLKPSETEY